MSDSTQIPSEEAPFVLRFQGFVGEYPEAEQRFEAFCISDLNLSVEETRRILAHPGVAVICRRNSLNDVVSLADVLQELGARVSIADPHTECSTLTTHNHHTIADISPQLEELLKAPSLGLIQSPCAPGEYVLTLNDSHEKRAAGGLSHARAMMHEHDREHASHHGASTLGASNRGARDLSGRQPSAALHSATSTIRNRRTRSIRFRAHSRRQTGLTGVQMIGMLIAGLACLLVINRAFVGKPQLNRTSASYPVAGGWGIDNSDVWSTGETAANSKLYDGTISRQKYSLTISVRMQDNSASARVLIVTPMHTKANSDGQSSIPQLRRAESDTTLLREIEPGVWAGRLITYLFIEQKGQTHRIPAQTELFFRGTPDKSSAEASIDLTSALPTSIQELQGAQGFNHALADGTHSLELHERVPLTSSVSF